MPSGARSSPVRVGDRGVSLHRQAVLPPLPQVDDSFPCDDLAVGNRTPTLTTLHRVTAAPDGGLLLGLARG